MAKFETTVDGSVTSNFELSGNQANGYFVP